MTIRDPGAPRKHILAADGKTPGDCVIISAMNAPLNTGDPLLDQLAKPMHWLLRGPLALVLVYHGVEKWALGPGGYAESVNLPAGAVLLLAGVEIAAGLGLILGRWLGDWVTRLGALAACLVLIAAILLVHWGQWHVLPSATHPLGGIEFPIALLGVALYLLIRGNAV